MMRSKKSVVLSALCLIGMVSAALPTSLDAASKKANGESKKLVSGALRFAGTCTANGTLQSLFDTFSRNRDDIPEYGLLYDGSMTEDGLTALLSGKAEVAVTRRPLTEEEEKRLTEHFNSKPLAMREYARAALVIIVHKNNRIRSLSHDQIAKIFRGEIKRWDEVKVPGGRIARYGTLYPQLSCGMLTRQVLDNKMIRLRPPLPDKVVSDAELSRIIREYRKKHPNGPFPRFKRDHQVNPAIRGSAFKSAQQFAGN